MDKQSLKNQMMEKRNQMTVKEVLEKSRLIVEKLKSLEIYQKAELILCYASYQKEVDTYALISESLSCKKQVALPRVNGKTMDFYYIHSLRELKPGYRNIPEPVTIRKVEKEEVKKALMIVPGTSFDCSFHRNGYGGGYYDRYMEQYPPAYKIGIAFSFQVLEEVPFEAHDKTVDYIISEVKIYGK